MKFVRWLKRRKVKNRLYKLLQDELSKSEIRIKSIQNASSSINKEIFQMELEEILKRQSIILKRLSNIQKPRI